MHEEHSWEIEFSKEISLAKSARESGNEGRARVCARRAAGTAAGKYLSHIQPKYEVKGALQNLTNLQSHPNIPVRLKNRVNLFLIHVDYDHNLPVDVDLIEEAINLKERLFSLIEHTYE